MAGRRGRDRGSARAGRKLCWTQADAQRRLGDWRASGLSLMAFCLCEGLGYERVRR